MKNTMKKVFQSTAILAAAAAISLSAAAFSSIHAASTTNPVKGYWGYDEIEAEMSRLDKEYGADTEVRTLAKTSDGRKVLLLRIGKENAAHKVFFFGAIHAREYITAPLVLWQAEELLENQKQNLSYKGILYSDLLKDTAVYVIPMVNPDGVSISRSGTAEILNDKVKEQLYEIYTLDNAVEIDEYFRLWKSNADGIDLNRQFDARWEEYNDHVGHPSSDHYKGKKIGEAAEAKALIDLTEKEKFARTVSYHTQGDVIYWYFGQTGKLREDTKRFADRISALTGYAEDSNFEKLDPAGYKDWAISKKGIPSLTIEVGSNGHPVPTEQFPSICEKNRYVIEETILDIREQGK